jgi:O-antigen/teichoic acid export membrane protein
MQGFIKTLFGDKYTVGVAALSIVVAVVILHTPVAVLAGIALPCCLLAGAAYLAKH